MKVRKHRPSGPRHLRMRPYSRKVVKTGRKRTNGMLTIEVTPMYVGRS